MHKLWNIPSNCTFHYLSNRIKVETHLIDDDQIFINLKETCFKLTFWQFSFVFTTSDWLVSEETEENLLIPEQRLRARQELKTRPKNLPISSFCSLFFINSDRLQKLIVSSLKERDPKNETVPVQCCRGHVFVVKQTSGVIASAYNFRCYGASFSYERYEKRLGTLRILNLEFTLLLHDAMNTVS